MTTPPGRAGGDNPYFLRLWLVVALLWTGATLYRVARMVADVEGWPAILRGPWLWVEVAFPWLVFGAVILALRYVARRWPRPRR
jgi:hypothetical protein